MLLRLTSYLLIDIKDFFDDKLNKKHAFKACLVCFKGAKQLTPALTASSLLRGKLDVIPNRNHQRR